jgi:hypothetical protein
MWSIRLIKILAFLLILLATGASAQTITIKNATYPPGTTTIADTVINQGFRMVRLTLDRTNWTNPAATVNAAFDFSSDGGKTWQSNWCSVTAAGGPFKPSNPSMIRTCYCHAATASCDGAKTANHIRGTITISGASITTGGSVVMQ